MAQVEIIAESETAGGWDFTAQILHKDGRLTQHRVRLAWADYNLWSRDGSDAPAAVAEAVLAFLMSKTLGDERDELPAKFDASLVRRRFADADETIPHLIG